LNIGDPDILTPDVMLKTLTTWHHNPISYSLSQGDPEFLAALEWYYHQLGYSFVTKPHIQVSSGGSEAISMAMFAITNPGDEVLTFEPLYANYNTFAAVNGVKLVAIPTTSENGFHLPPKAEMERYITSKTKAILYCNPNNPTGTVYTKEEVELLVELAKEHNLFLLSDEVYREFTYDERPHTSLLAYMESLPDQLIVLDSLSKRYSLCGARLGMVVSLNTQLMAGILRLAQGRLSSGFIDQKMAATLTQVPASYFAQVHQEYQTRRDVLYEGLKSIPGVTLAKPEGAFYTMVGLPVADSEAFCTWLLTDFRHQQQTVMMAPGSGFYATPGMGNQEVRIAYVLNVEKLKRSIEILAQALKTYTP
jgi:aspartate aminotransferase